MEAVPEQLARWAVGEGRGAIDEAAALLADGADELAVGTELRRRLDPARAAFASAAAATRLRAVAQRVPGAAELVLTREALEQASHPAAAAWRASRAAVAATDADRRTQDRCAGTGADAVALAEHRPVLAIERDPGRAVLAADRARVLGRDVEVVCGDALAPTPSSAGAVVHVDPDRRDHLGRRARRLAQHGPAVAALLEATREALGHLVTVAPGVAWDDPDLPAGAEVVFLQHGRDLLEAVLCTGAARPAGARATAVLLDRGAQRSRGPGEVDELPVGDPGGLLLTPAPALVRARLHDEVGRELGARRLATRSALLTCDELPLDDTWVGVERIEAILPGRPRAVRDHLRTLPDRAVELVLHGVRTDVRSWLRAAGDPPTGPDDLRVHLLRRDHDTVAVLTSVHRPDVTARGHDAGTVGPR